MDQRLTHTELFDAVANPLSLPRPDCGGDVWIDAQMRDEDPIDRNTVLVNIYRCRDCRWTIVVEADRAGGGLWDLARLRNTYPPSGTGGRDPRAV
jgi:hypothetical protein